MPRDPRSACPPKISLKRTSREHEGLNRLSSGIGFRVATYHYIGSGCKPERPRPNDRYVGVICARSPGAFMSLFVEYKPSSLFSPDHDAHEQGRFATGVHPEMIGATLNNPIERFQLDRSSLVEKE
jgi:hypothetical protein